MTHNDLTSSLDLQVPVNSRTLETLPSVPLDDQDIMQSIKPQSMVPMKPQEALSDLLTMPVIDCLARNESKMPLSLSISDARSYLQEQLNFIKETSIELRMSNPEKPKQGKVALPIAKYGKRSQARIEALDKKMREHERQSPMWLKLRKQKLAQKSRYNKRMFENQ